MASHSAGEPPSRRLIRSHGSIWTGATSRFFAVLLLLGVLATQPGCAWSKKNREAKRKAAAEKNRKVGLQLAGVITLVNLEGGFVLVDSGNHPAPLPGVKLKSRTGAQESAELRVSEIRRNPFTIADIISGVPIKGDLVYQ